MRRTAVIVLMLSIAACSDREPARETVAAAAVGSHVLPPPAPTEAPAGLYELEPSLSRVAFTVQYVDRTLVTFRVGKAEAALQLEPADPQRSTILVTLDAASMQSDVPGFDALVEGPDFLDAERYPKITFQSTGVVRTGADTAEVIGDLSLHGVTRPVTLKAAFDAAGTLDAEHPRVRFTAQTTLRRSDFGITATMPMAGDPAGVVEQVQVSIDATFRRVNPTPPRVTASASGRKSLGSQE